ncbi:MAG: hypothetical protein JF615_09970 [Asticcacaulis sp.]|nr:hypothetical protein [Asticcacaulis sp.]
MEGFTAAHGVAVVRPADVLCDDGFCHVWRPDVGVLYFNGQHMSMAGARLVAGRVPL